MSLGVRPAVRDGSGGGALVQKRMHDWSALRSTLDFKTRAHFAEISTSFSSFHQMQLTAIIADHMGYNTLYALCTLGRLTVSVYSASFPPSHLTMPPSFFMMIDLHNGRLPRKLCGRTGFLSDMKLQSRFPSLTQFLHLLPERMADGIVGPMSDAPNRSCDESARPFHVQVGR